MKLRSLHINQFGHFADFDLPLAGDGFQVLLGRNEAGKTTLLEFLRSVLFGFPERTPYAFAGSAELGGVATMTLADGREVELRRRKGRKNTVSIQIDGQDTAIDETGFSHLLGHANRNLFSSVFAFGLSELSSGEESLKHESLQSALFGGGLGGAFSTEKVLAALQANADELFKEGGKVPAINKLSSELKEIAKQIKGTSVRSDEYVTREQALRDAELVAQRLREEVHSLRQRQSYTDKLANALPRWTERKILQRERESLSIPATFPSDGRGKFADINRELSRLTAEEKDQSRQIEEDEEQLRGITVEDLLLPLKPEIEACNRLIQSVADARRDHPLRQEEYNRQQREVADELAELCPTWTIDDLQAFKVDAATRAEIERLIQTRRDLDQSCTKLTTRRDDLDSRLKQNAEDADSLSEIRDVSALSAVLDDAADYQSNAKTLKRQHGERLKLESAVSARVLKLTPPMPAGLADPERLPVPRPEVVAKFQREFADLQQRLRAARQSCRDEEEHLAELVAMQAASTSSRDAVPSRDELAASRERRDAGWQLIRSTFVEGEDRSADVARWLNKSASSTGDLSDVYEASVAEADDMADKQFENAEAVARLEQLREQIRLARTAVVKKQTGVQLLLDEQLQWDQRWQSEWQPCGLNPLAPDVMAGWLDDHAALRATVEQHEQLTVEVDSLKAGLTAFETRLRSVCGQPDGDPQLLLTQTKSAVKDAEEQIKERQALEKDRRQIANKLAETTAKLTTLADDVAVWQRSWQELLEQLRLPTTWDTELARGVIERLLATRSKLESLPSLKGRIDAMSDRLAEFGCRVEKLCDQVGDPARQHDPEVAVKILSNRLAVTTLADERRRNLQQKLDDARRKMEDVKRDLNAAATARRALLADADAESDSEFDAVASRAETMAELDVAIARLTHEIDVIPGPEDRETFETQLSQSDLGILQGELRDLTAELQNREASWTAAEGRCGECRSQLKLLDGSAAAAELQQTLARQQARLASDVHRFVPLLFARHLLQEAIRRFERENQPELVGSISRLFATMTAGRYVEIERPSGERHAIIIRRRDGAERTSEQLSTGTRELLYLAIRLGYVLHYCRQTEPLPIVMDDVLVNFDDARARSTLEALRDVSQQVQILFFTCHPHFVSLAQEVFPGLRPLSLSDPPA